MTRANRQPAVAVYHDVGGGPWEPFAIHVVDAVDGKIATINGMVEAPNLWQEWSE